MDRRALQLYMNNRRGAYEELRELAESRGYWISRSGEITGRLKTTCNFYTGEEDGFVSFRDAGNPRYFLRGVYRIPIWGEVPAIVSGRAEENCLEGMVRDLVF